MSPVILVVDDDLHIRDVIVFALKKAEFDVIEAENGASALSAFNTMDVALVILDIGLPEIDGLDVCREIRKKSEIPILFLSARDDEIDRIVGLEIGGDDYVTKPFSPRELVARVRVILKRWHKPAASQADHIANHIMAVKPLVYGNINLDKARHTISFNGVPVALTATEFAILEAFLRYPEFVRDRNSLIEAAYDLNVHVSDRTVDSHIRHIRAKFAATGCTSIIETVHGVGYRLGRCV
ncbi:MAG: response regulator transcription factor [Pseudomonadota bacterium]